MCFIGCIKKKRVVKLPYKKSNEKESHKQVHVDTLRTDSQPKKEKKRKIKNKKKIYYEHGNTKNWD